MKILYDSHIFINQKKGGISRYHYELYKRIRDDGYGAIIAGKFIKNRYLLEDKHYGKAFWNDPTSSFALFDKIMISRAIKKGDYDLFHPTIAYEYFLGDIPDEKRVVLTIHDMIREKQQPGSEACKLKLAQRANKIITVSQTTKNDVVDLWNIDSDKIQVINQGSSLKPEMASKAPVNLPPEHYVFFVGDRGGYKNFDTFAKAVASVMKKNTELFLVCVGRPFSEEEKKLLTELGILSRTMMYTNISDNDMVYLYCKASVFVFPSFSEGFGLPILESWACNVPLVISNIPCFTEIAAEAAYYVEPSSAESIAEGIDRMISDKTLKNDLLEKGRKRLQMYSWDKNYQLTYKAYQSLF